MKNKFQIAVALVALTSVAAPVNAQVKGDKIPGSYVCVFKNEAVARGNVPNEANRIAQENGGQINHIYTVALRGFAANFSAQAVENLMAKNPNIASCEQDQIMAVAQFVGNAKPGGGGTTTVLPPQEMPWGIARVGGGTSGTFATAWVIDSGIDLTHPDLNVDRSRSISFLGSRTTPQDQNGHGTHVAGTIAARDNFIGVIGVAPGAPVVSVRVLDRSGSGSTTGVIAGVDYVARSGFPGDVASMSLGGGISPTLDNAVVAAAARGVRFAIAAGNANANANNYSPARADGPNVFTVSAFGIDDLRASYSNFGNPPIDYAEPGSGIKSTWLNGGYNTISGTSMAAPHLAGLLLQGSVRSGGYVSGFDPDGIADVIGVK
jgi:subtilisin family serine protease